MATAQLSASPIRVSGRALTSFKKLTPSTMELSSFGMLKIGTLTLTHMRPFKGLVMQAATTAAPKYTSIKPLGDRVLVKTETAEEKTDGSILLPANLQPKPQKGAVVAVSERKATGNTEVVCPVKTGVHIIYSKYAGTEVEFNGENHLLLKHDDIVGILETDDIKDLKPVNSRVLIKVTTVEEKTAVGLYLTDAFKEKPSTGTVIAVGPSGGVDKDGNHEPPPVAAGNIVLFPKYTGNDYKGKDGSEYIALRVSDLMAVLS